MTLVAALAPHVALVVWSRCGQAALPPPRHRPLVLPLRSPQAGLAARDKLAASSWLAASG